MAQDVAAIQRPRAMDAHAHDVSGPAGDGHLGMALFPVHEAPVRRRGEVAEGCAVGAGEHGGHEAPGERDALMADGVDAAMQPVQPAAPHATHDRIAVEFRQLEVAGSRSRL